ncbi:DUF4232 domain-containing protein [Streptomyces caniferus]|uniref:DUF4232 domain-containing protein n=1 Tax=Streptomyces caniferus TaxID=285557 RepID=UPI003802F313
MRFTPHTTRLVASGAVLAAALSLTACENDSKKAGSPAPAASSQPGSGGQGAPSSAAAKVPAKEGDTSKASSVSGKETGGKNGSSTAGGKGSGSQKATAACTGAQVKVTVTKVNRPLNHLLLTATNTGFAPCHAYNAPYLRWDDAQSATTFLDKSKPQAVITLAPGQSAYAGVMYRSADASGNSAFTARTLGVLFANRAGNGSTGPAARLPLPKGGTRTDSSAWVTYWQSTASDALTW